ncbi:hypothetical protein BS50DRAFT_343064 [Corynespora cassiicola Philippines]|uniref:Uncharacterized protein n=1 Tax=Corynespora cassiicola Philippines TaxID=1448308 RepID=A0A2T2NVS3_CORCC|nr:hypothetical protein BS50DRAFT_343064 [Corynespora cassiicola Philippines]
MRDGHGVTRYVRARISPSSKAHTECHCSDTSVRYLQWFAENSSGWLPHGPFFFFLSAGLMSTFTFRLFCLERQLLCWIVSFPYVHILCIVSIASSRIIFHFFYVISISGLSLYFLYPGKAGSSVIRTGQDRQAGRQSGFTYAALLMF